MVKKWFPFALIFFCVAAFGSTKKSKILVDNTPFYFKKAEKIDQYTTRIPFELVDRLIIIKGTYKQKKGGFILDTGSEKLILNATHFPNLLLGGIKQYNTSGVVDYIDNPVQKRIKQIQFRDLAVNNKKTDVIDLSHIEKNKKIHLLGIIGYNLLKDYEIFIDLHLEQITLKQIDPKGNVMSKQPYLEKIQDTINFTLKKHAIVLKGFINQKKVTFALDTGAEYNQISNKIGKKSLKYFYPKKRIKLIGASKKSAEVLYGNMFRIRLSNAIYFGPMKTIVANLSHIQKAFGTKLDGILGHDFFAQKRVIINYKKQQLYFIDYPHIKR